jgi:hypothetical protein
MHMHFGVRREKHKRRTCKCLSILCLAGVHMNVVKRNAANVRSILNLKKDYVAMEASSVSMRTIAVFDKGVFKSASRAASRQFQLFNSIAGHADPACRVERSTNSKIRPVQSGTADCPRTVCHTRQLGVEPDPRCLPMLMCLLCTTLVHHRLVSMPHVPSDEPNQLNIHNAHTA